MSIKERARRLLVSKRKLREIDPAGHRDVVFAFGGDVSSLGREDGKGRKARGIDEAYEVSPRRYTDLPDDEKVVALMIVYRMSDVEARVYLEMENAALGRPLA